MSEQPSSPADLARAKDIFSDLAELSAEERAPKLAEIEAIDPVLAAAVRRLLAANDRAGRFLVSSATQPETGGVPLALRQLGPYKLLQEIGEGGFGTVYMAEQSAPIRRYVAVKILKPGIGSKNVVARFEAERQALALMEHSNIARVFDGGTAGDGRPYFVMELVNGVPITQYCDEAKLTVTERLRLFVPVCQAVHHAHQKGVIHRDLKPTNVLVTLHDGQPVPKVIDFGIAKAIDRPLTDKTLFTELRAMVGTPEYMSPEQAEISGLDIDTRSDVYSLGVLLYELLAGTTPFDPKDLRSKAYGEMQRIIREVDPPRPSERLSTLQTVAVVADARRTEARRLTSVIRGELDWIVMKCLEKDRRRRYDSASNLAHDIERYLGGEAVEAGPPSRTYKLRKTIARHRVLVAAAAAVAITLAGGLTASLIALKHARTQQRLAQEQRQIADTQRSRADDRAAEARREADRAELVTQFLVDVISEADPYRQASNDPKLSQVLEEAARRLDAGRLSQEPRAEASLRAVVGRTLEAVGRRDDALRQIERGLALRRAEQPLDPNSLALMLNLLALIEYNRGELGRSVNALDEAAALLPSLTETKLHRDIRFNLATIKHLASGNAEAARSTLETLLKEYRADAKAAPLDLATVLDGLSSAAAFGTNDRERIAAAEAYAREAVALRRKHESPSSPSTAQTVITWADLLARTGKVEECIKELTGLIDEMLRVQGDERTIAYAREFLGIRLVNTGKIEEGLSALRLAVEANLRLDGPETHRAMASRLQLGAALNKAGKFDEAVKELAALWDVMKTMPGSDPSRRAQVANQLATALWKLGRNEEAIPLFRSAQAEVNQLKPPPPLRYNNAGAGFANAYAIGRYEEALSLAEEQLAAADLLYAADAPERASAARQVARALVRLNRDLARAEAPLHEALRIHEANYPPGHPSHSALAATRLTLGILLLREGKVDDAAPLIEQGAAAIEADKASPDYARREALEYLGELRKVRPATPATTQSSQ